MRKTIALLLVLSLLSSFAVTVFAHPGRTDSSGGHRDSDTGEYHYHHGYPEHDHTDIDGDGVLECPYNFDDKTSSKSNSSNVRKNERNPGVFRMNSIWYYTIATVFGFFLGYFIRGKFAQSEISDLNRKHKNEVDRLTLVSNRRRIWIKNEVLRRQAAARDAKRKQAIENAKSFPPDAKINFRDPHPLSLFYNFNNDDDPLALPPGVYLDDGDSLYLGYKDKSSPYGNFTVYIAYGSDVYHMYPECRNYRALFPANILNVVGTRRPCAICGTRELRGKQLPAWYLNFKKASRELEIDW